MVSIFHYLRPDPVAIWCAVTCGVLVALYFAFRGRLCRRHGHIFEKVGCFPGGTDTMTVLSKCLRCGVKKHENKRWTAKDQTDSAFRDAIEHRDVARIRTLLGEGADLTATDDEGKTPLMAAAKAGSPEIVEILLKAGADPRPKDKFGYTAEMTAYWYGEYRMGSYTPESKKIVEMLQQPRARKISSHKVNITNIVKH